jgi:H+/Cl- antiporter ClcA
MTPDQEAYLERRRRQIRYWPFMAVVLVAVLGACYGWLYVKAPVYVSPAELVRQLTAQKLGVNQLATLAALGNLAFIACGLFILALIAITTIALRNERHLIRLLDAECAARRPAADTPESVPPPPGGDA